MVRIDKAGQASKRFAGASGSPLAETDGRCPYWALHDAFAMPGRLVTQIVTLEDGSQWFTMARTVTPQGARAGQARTEFAIGLGLEAALAEPLAAARGTALDSEATPVGLGCPACTRPQCPQRAAPPRGRALVFNEKERGLTPFGFTP